MDHFDLNLNYTGDDPEFMFSLENNLTPESTDHDEDFFNNFSDTNDFFFEEASNNIDNIFDNDLIKEQDSSQTIHPKNNSAPIGNQLINQQETLTFLPRGSKNHKTISQSKSSVKGLFSSCSTRASKRKVSLSRQASDFKKLFYQIFTSKKRFPKEIVRKIHEIILIPLKLKKMSRDEYRMIDLYFQQYAQYSTQILIYLQKHKEEILDAIPEMSKLK